MKSSFKICSAPACKFMNISRAMQAEQQIAAGTSEDSKCSVV